MICVPFTTPRVWLQQWIEMPRSGWGANWIITERNTPLPVMMEFFAYETIGVAVCALSAEQLARLDFS